MKATQYVMTLKNGSRWRLAADGGVLYDGERHMSFDGEHWRIIGFTRRHLGGPLITLDAAVNGADLGQGWIHDLDHGTRRMWGMPKHHRVVRVERTETSQAMR